MRKTAKLHVLDATSLWKLSTALLPIFLLGALTGGCGSCVCPGGAGFPPPPGSDGDLPFPSESGISDSGWVEDAGADAGSTDSAVPCPNTELFWSEVSHDKEYATVTIHNWPCALVTPPVLPLYIYTDLCYGTIVTVERLNEATGTFEALQRAYDCALGGPTAPIEIAPYDDHIVVTARFDWIGADPGTFRVVFWVSDWWSCPGGDVALCASNHPWQVHVTPEFFWSN